MKAPCDIAIGQVTLRTTGGTSPGRNIAQNLRAQLHTALRSAAAGLHGKADIDLSRLRIRLGTIDLHDTDALRRSLTRALREALEQMTQAVMPGDAPAAREDPLMLFLTEGVVRADLALANDQPQVRAIRAGSASENAAAHALLDRGARERLFRLIENALREDPAGSGTAAGRRELPQRGDPPVPGTVQPVTAPDAVKSAKPQSLTASGTATPNEDSRYENGVADPTSEQRSTGPLFSTVQTPPQDAIRGAGHRRAGDSAPDDVDRSQIAPGAPDLVILRALAGLVAAAAKTPVEDNPVKRSDGLMAVTQEDFRAALAAWAANTGPARASHPAAAASGSRTTARTAELAEHLCLALGHAAPAPQELARRLSRWPLSLACLAVLNQNPVRRPATPAQSPGRPVDAPPRKTLLMTGGAGLVLLRPFLHRFLDALDCAPGRSRNDALRAAFILHRLTGQTDAPEHKMLLARILAGLPTTVPLPISDPPEAEEAREADKLMRSVTAAWPALRSSSVQALQETFLDRPGTLIFRGTHWQLSVPPQSFDLLLDGLPWGISTLRLPWMPQPVITDWPVGKP